MAVTTARRADRARSEDDTILVALAVVSGLLTMYALYAFYAVGMDRSDFYLFYRSGYAWTHGQAIYPLDENPNLNPPLAIALIFAPLALLPYALAQTVWISAGAASVVASVLAVRRAFALTNRQTAWLVVILHVTHAAFLVWLQGQVTWILLYPVTRAWLASRANRQLAAGLWLAPAIAIKPILALLALALPVRVWLAAGSASAAVTAGAIGWTGWPPWATWLRVGSDVSWIAWPPNASLWGVAARVQSGALKGLMMRDLDTAASAGVMALLALAWILVVRTTAPDRRFTLALFWMILASPLGWIYYLPLALGSITATWPRSRLVWVSVALLAVPFHIIQDWFSSPAVIRTVGCIYGAAVLLAFVVWWAEDRRETRAAAAP